MASASYNIVLPYSNAFLHFCSTMKDVSISWAAKFHNKDTTCTCQQPNWSSQCVGSQCGKASQGLAPVCDFFSDHGESGRVSDKPLRASACVFAVPHPRIVGFMLVGWFVLVGSKNCLYEFFFTM